MKFVNFVNLEVAPDTDKGFRMRKWFLILLAAIGFGFSANAQDIILKQDGSEIKAKVLEITDQQIKYKDFDYIDGPTRSIHIFEVFMITYENGQKEVFNRSDYSSKRQSVTTCAKNTAFGLDIGLGGSFYKVYNEKSPSLFASSVGIRVMHHFNPYFGIDFLKLNWITDVSDNVYTMRLQFMPGIRGNTPTFFECMSVYSAFRLGYGMDFRLLTISGASHYESLCLEAELGLNLTPTVFAGFAYNCHKYFVKGSDSKLAMHTFSFRSGFNFGKAKVNSKDSRNLRMPNTYTEQRPVQPQRPTQAQAQPQTQISTTPMSPLQIEFNQIGNKDKAMLEFFRKNNWQYYNRFNAACKQKKTATGWLVPGIALTAGGIAVLIGREIVLKNAHPYEILLNNNYQGLTVAGSILIATGQVFTIVSIPIYATAASKKKAIKNDFVREQFGGGYSYYPALNIGITQNGNIGLTLNF